MNTPGTREVQKITRDDAIKAFRAHFGKEPEIVVRTPGRVNLLGEHTDYSKGFVLPMTISRAVWMAFRACDQNVARLYSADYDEDCSFGVERFSKQDRPDYFAEKDEDGEKRQPIPWFEYIRASVWALSDQGKNCKGFEAVVLGDIPQGVGLASSAALEVSTILALNELGGYNLSKPDMAKLAQRAENEWIGLKSGVMNPMICLIGEPGKVFLVDCGDLKYTSFDMPNTVAVAFMDTGVRHYRNGATYNKRREQCAEICEILGVENLRMTTQEMLEGVRDKIPSSLFSKAYHVLYENMRVQSAASALQYSEFDILGKLISESHFSLQYSYEVSCFELDAICDVARSYPACLGARMAGSCLGGGAIALIYAAKAQDFAEKVLEGYYKQTGKKATITFGQATEGAKAERL
ncbi:galactokinase [Synergistales bacterium]|nr:galactokinase [Synergistales bacterium]